MKKPLSKLPGIQISKLPGMQKHCCRVACEEPDCTDDHTLMVRDFLFREDTKTGKTKVQQYGPDHFFCVNHIRLSRLLKGFPLSVARDSIDYYRDQMKSCGVTPKKESHDNNNRRDKRYGTRNPRKQQNRPHRKREPSAYSLLRQF